MDKRDERSSNARADQSGKRKYEPPQILSQEVFETTALACMKVAGGGGCGAFPKS
jgi:hypothetical protein